MIKDPRLDLVAYVRLSSLHEDLKGMTVADLREEAPKLAGEFFDEGDDRRLYFAAMDVLGDFSYILEDTKRARNVSHAERLIRRRCLSLHAELYGTPSLSTLRNAGIQHYLAGEFEGSMTLLHAYLTGQSPNGTAMTEDFLDLVAEEAPHELRIRRLTRQGSSYAMNYWDKEFDKLRMELGDPSVQRKFFLRYLTRQETVTLEDVILMDYPLHLLAEFSPFTRKELQEAEQALGEEVLRNSPPETILCKLLLEKEEYFHGLEQALVNAQQYALRELGPNPQPFDYETLVKTGYDMKAARDEWKKKHRFLDGAQNSGKGKSWDEREEERGEAYLQRAEELFNKLGHGPIGEDVRVTKNRKRRR